MQPLTIIFIGPQGSGKGTQIEKLMSLLDQAEPARNVVEIQTGRGFRAMVKSQTTFAEKKVISSMQAGDLQPDFLTNILWGQEMLTQLDNESHLLIDGFPRNIDQAKVLDEALAFFERGSVSIINLDTPEEVVKERMLARGREDDSVASIEHRLQQYRKETLPVLDFYSNRSNTSLHNIEGTDTIEGVSAQILAALKLNSHD
jgi:adenylate kinase